MIRHEVAWDDDIRRLMERASRPLVIHKRRQSGGTTELLRFAQKMHRLNFAVVAPTEEMALAVKALWRKENGFEITLSGDQINYPRIISAGSFPLKLRGHEEMENIYVDEWNMLTDGQQHEVSAYGNLRMAVTS